MAMLDRAYDLQKDSFYEPIITDVLHVSVRKTVSIDSHTSLTTPTYPLPFSNHGKKVSSMTKIHDDENKISPLDRFVYCDYVWMPTGEIVKRELAELLFMCRCVGLRHDQDLYCVIQRHLSTVAVARQSV